MLILALAVLGEADPVWAHKGEARPADAATAVRQALAFLDAVPPNFGEAAEKAKWALEAKDQAGVDRSTLEQATDALRAKDAARARELLRQALAQAVGTPAAQAPRDIAGRPVDHRAEAEAHYRQGAPLDSLTLRFEGRGGEYGILALAATLAIAGALVLWRA
jgi:hypothetical protein